MPLSEEEIDQMIEAFEAQVDLDLQQKAGEAAGELLSACGFNENIARAALEDFIRFMRASREAE